MNELQRFKSLQQEVRISIQPVPQLSRFEQLGLRMIEDTQLRGLAERTQESYLRAVRKLAEHYQKAPDEVTDEELRDYFLLRVKEIPFFGGNIWQTPRLNQFEMGRYSRSSVKCYASCIRRVNGLHAARPRKAAR